MLPLQRNDALGFPPNGKRSVDRAQVEESLHFAGHPVNPQGRPGSGALAMTPVPLALSAKFQLKSGADRRMVQTLSVDIVCWRRGRAKWSGRSWRFCPPLF